MQIYLINLKHRPDRLAKMEAALAGLGLTFERIEAVDGAAPDFIRPKEHRLSGPAYACYLSHIKAYRVFLGTNAPRCVIMEDDVILSPRLPEALANGRFFAGQNAIVRLERPTNLFWHAPSYCKPWPVMAENGLATYELLSKSFGTGAFVLPRGIAKTMVEQHAMPEFAIDVRLFNRRRAGHPGFKIRQFSPSLAVQTSHYNAVPDSDIPHKNTHSSRHTHPLQRNIVRNLRRIGAAAARLAGFNRRFPFACK